MKKISIVFLLHLLWVVPGFAAEEPATGREGETTTGETETQEEEPYPTRVTFGFYAGVGAGAQVNPDHFKALPFDTTSAASTFQLGIRLDVRLLRPFEVNFWPGFATTNYGTILLADPNLLSTAVRLPLGATIWFDNIGLRGGGYYRHVFNSKLAAENVSVTGPVNLEGIDAEIGFDFGFYAGFTIQVDKRIEIDFLAMAEQDVFDFVFLGGFVGVSYKVNRNM